MNKNKIYDLLSEGNVTDAVSVLLEELEGPELDNHAKELENEATKESKPEVISKEVGNKEVYPSDEHKEKEDVKEVVVESEQVAAGPELKEPKELENEAAEPSKPEELKSDLDNEDVYPEDEHLDAEEVEEAIVESIEVYNYLMESTDEEFAALMESFDEDEYEYCEYLLSEDFENLLIESEVLNESGYITLDEGRRWEKFKKGAKKVLKYGAGAATIGGTGAVGYQVGKHGVKAVGAAIKSGLKTAGGYLGAGSVASTAGGALAGAALGAGAIYAGKKIAQKIKKEKDITNRLNQKGETKISLDGKTTEKYDYRNRKNRRKAELIRNKYAHADKLSQAKAELKKAKRGSDDTAYENAKKSLKDAKTQYKADKANIKYKDKLKAKLARLEAAKELEDEKYPKEVKKEKPKEVVKEKPEEPKKEVVEKQEEPKKEVVEKQEEPKEVVKESYELPLLESTDFELMQWLHENNFVPSFSNVNELRLIMEEMEVNEDILDSNPEAEKAEENFETPEKFAPTADETADEMDKLLSVSPVEEVELSESMKSIFSILDRINEGAQVAAGPELKEPKELKNEATDENKKEEVAEDKDNKDVYPSDEHREAEEVEEVIIENVATEEKAPETMEQEVDNKDVYSTPEHKEVEDVVEVVVEAAKLCSENGVPATLANITKYAKTLFESEGVALNVGKPEEKEYDADADIESAEMNGNKEEFEKYEDIQGEGAKAAKAEESVVEPKDLHESVNYTSLREACLLDESYFSTDSYTIQTADEKVEKLTEQVSLLLAREAMDPLYEELLTTSIKAQRLQEACAKKYRKLAEDKVTRISKRLPR